MADLNGEQTGLRCIVERPVENLRLVSRALRVGRAQSQHYADSPMLTLFLERIVEDPQTSLRQLEI